MAVPNQLASIAAALPTTHEVELVLPGGNHSVELRIPRGSEAIELMNDVTALGEDSGLPEQMKLASKWWQRLAGPVGQPAAAEDVDAILAAAGFAQAIRPVLKASGLDQAGSQDDIPT